MFICKGCLAKKYTNEESIRRPHGRCESCGKIGECSDIPSSHLRRKQRRAKDNSKWN